ncbi:hypothetical protein GGI09_009095 [Coemansia sp. S100]|nr:hypothetical protein GGI09_009095 [Coemansia sp. S100]
MPAIVRVSVYVAVAAAVLHVFNTFSYITYSRTWTKDACQKTKWLKTWDFDCEHAIGGVRATDPPPPSSATEAAKPIDVVEDNDAAEEDDDAPVDDAVPEPEQVALTSPSSAIGSVDAEESSSVGNIADIDSPVSIPANAVIEKSNPVAVHVAPNFEPPVSMPAVGINPEPKVNVSAVSVAYSDVEDTGAHAEL